MASIMCCWINSNVTELLRPTGVWVCSKIIQKTSKNPRTVAGRRAGVSVDETVALCVSRSASEAIDASVTNRSAYASARVLLQDALRIKNVWAVHRRPIARGR